MEGGDGNRHDDADRDLVLDEVGHRVHAGHLSGVVRGTGGRTHVKTGDCGDDGCSGETGGAKTHEDRVDRDHQEHREAGGGRDEEVGDRADDVGEREHEVRRAEDAQRPAEVVGHDGGGADHGHVLGVAGSRHDQQTDACGATRHQRRDALEEVEADEARAGDALRKDLGAVGQKPERVHGDRADEKREAAEEEHELCLHLLEQDDHHHDGDQKRNDDADHG